MMEGCGVRATAHSPILVGALRVVVARAACTMRLFNGR